MHPPTAQEADQVEAAVLSPHQRWRWIAILVIAAAFVFHMTTLRPGHDWGGDFSLYILHARNIAAGHPYADTPFVYSDLFLTHSPRSYPPVYPLLLAPVYAIYGLDYTPLKVLTGLFLPLSWLVLLQLNGISGLSRLLLILLSAACPIFWTFKDSVLPDIPYMAFLLITLWLNQRAYTSGDNEKHPLRAGLLVALAMLTAYGTRSSGLVLPIAVAGYDLIRARRVTLYALSATLGFLAMVIVLNNLIGRNEQSYMAQFANLTPGLVVQNIIDYVRSFAYIWNGGGRIAQYGLFFLACAAAAIGFLVRVRQWSSAMELFFLGHLALIAIWPGASGVRYALPLIPFFLFYVMAGFERIRFSRAAVVFTMLTLAIYGLRYTNVPRGPIEAGPRQATFQQMVRYLQTASSPEELHVFWNPRLLALYTGHRSMTYGPQASGEVNWREFVKKRVRYIVIYLPNSDDRRVLEPMVKARPEVAGPVWANQDYAVYRIGGDD